MKRRILGCMVGVLLLAGCAAETAEQEQEILKEPPVLTVESGEARVEAARGTSSWLYSTGGDTMTGMESCHAHPLEYQDSVTALYADGETAVLCFDAAPDSVTACCWSDACWGDIAAESQETDVTDGALSLRPGGWVYEVTAKWDSSDLYGGTARYVVYIVAPE